MFRFLSLLSMAVAVRGTGMPVLCNGGTCEASEFMLPTYKVDPRPCYIAWKQVDGMWVDTAKVPKGRLAGTLLPPRLRLNDRRNISKGETTPKPRPFVETVWESYVSYPYNYTSCPNSVSNIVDTRAYAHRLADVPVTSTDGMHSGADIVNIAYAFADEHRCTKIATDCQPYICGLHLFKNVEGDAERYQNLLEDIQALKRKGAVVSLAFGGDEWGNLMFNSASKATADVVVDDMIRIAIELHVDGINLVQEKGVGVVTMGDDSESSVQLYMIDALRARMPAEMMLTYTFPGDEVTFPFRDIVKYGHLYLDHINVHMANSESMAWFMEMGVPQGRMTWGIPIGCNEEAEGGKWALEKTIQVAKLARDHEFAGVFHWSIERDTNRRVLGLGCCPLQTGMPDGTYITNIADILVSPAAPTAQRFYQGSTWGGHPSCGPLQNAHPDQKYIL